MIMEVIGCDVCNRQLLIEEKYRTCVDGLIRPAETLPAYIDKALICKKCHKSFCKEHCCTPYVCSCFERLYFYAILHGKQPTKTF